MECGVPTPQQLRQRLRGQNTGTTNVPLNGYGEFFRLAMISTQHMTNSTTSLARLNVVEIPIHKQELVDGRIRVSFVSEPKARYEVQHLEWSGALMSSQEVTAEGTLTTASFEPALGSAGAFKVLRWDR